MYEIFHAFSYSHGVKYRIHTNSNGSQVGGMRMCARRFLSEGKRGESPLFFDYFEVF